MKEKHRVVTVVLSVLMGCAIVLSSTLALARVGERPIDRKVTRMARAQKGTVVLQKSKAGTKGKKQQDWVDNVRPDTYPADPKGAW